MSGGLGRNRTTDTRIFKELAHSTPPRITGHAHYASQSYAESFLAFMPLGAATFWLRPRSERDGLVIAAAVLFNLAHKRRKIRDPVGIWFNFDHAGIQFRSLTDQVLNQISLCLC